MKVEIIENRSEKLLNRLLEIQESSVKATHDFLSEKDISDIKPDVKNALENVEVLLCEFNEVGNPQGFMGVEKEKIEMLFVDANSRGLGIGKELLNYAIEFFFVTSVDVNEQNTKGYEFYIHMGFKVISKSELDDQGRPFPILHLAL